MTASPDSVLRARRVIADALGLALDDVGADATTETLEDWDSLQHLHVVMAVEAEGGRRLATDAVPTMNSVANIAAHFDALGVGS